MRIVTLVITLGLVATSVILTACATSNDYNNDPIIIPPQSAQICQPISALQRVVIPAETEKFYAITEIDNPPYDPIVRTEERTRVIKETEVIYIDSQGREVTNLCDPENDPDYKPRTESVPPASLNTPPNFGD